MEYHDFVRLFTSLTLCEDLSSQYQCWKLNGRWGADLTNNGGFPTLGATEEEFDRFAKNPQVIITVQKQTSLFILLSQPNARVLADHNYKYPFTGINYSVGFAVFKLKEGQEKLKDIRWSEKLSVPILSAGREVSRSFQLAPGRYSIVTYGESSKVEGNFTLKVFLDCPVESVTLRTAATNDIKKFSKPAPINLDPALKEVMLTQAQKAHYVDQKKMSLAGMLKE